MKQKDLINIINIVKGVIENMKVLTKTPMNILLSEKDFGTPLTKKDNKSLLIPSSNEILFHDMITACLKGTWKF